MRAMSARSLPQTALAEAQLAAGRLAWKLYVSLQQPWLWWHVWEKRAEFVFTLVSVLSIIYLQPCAWAVSNIPHSGTLSSYHLAGLKHFVEVICSCFHFIKEKLRCIRGRGNCCDKSQRNWLLIDCCSWTTTTSSQPPFCSKAALWSVMKDNYALSCLPIPSLHNGWSLVHAGVFVHLRCASFHCRGWVNWLPVPCIQFYSVKTEMHSPLPSALCWHEQMRRWMSVVSVKSPLISCEGVNTSQELLLFSFTLVECRKKWTCGVAFIVQEMFGNPQECAGPVK